MRQRFGRCVRPERVGHAHPNADRGPASAIPREHLIRRGAATAVALGSLALISIGTAGAQQVPEVVTVIDGVEFPTAIAFASDGSMFVNERGGRILRVDERAGTTDVVAEVETTIAGETGLLGLAVSPDDRDLFAFATDPSGTENRVIRVNIEGGTQEVIVDGLPASVYHNGGGVEFDRDGMLIVSNGETHDSSRSQDAEELGGKIYRLSPDGSPAAGNPFGPSIAIGLRNPFGLTLDPVTGDAFVTENGPTSFDEIDRIVEGGNYGWPDVSGSTQSEPELTGPGTYVDPLIDYPETIIPTGIAVADPATALPEVSGDVFFGSYSENAIHRLRLDDARLRAVSDDIYLQEDEPVIALEWGPRGLYYSTPQAVRLIPLTRPPRPGESRGTDGTPRDLVGPPLRPGPEPNRNLYLLIGGGVALALIVVIGMALRSRR